MRFPAELERELYRLIQVAPEDHIVFAEDEYTDGHIVIYRDNLAKSLHRFLYEAAFGKLPATLFLERTCRERRCVNPHHYRTTDRSRPLQQQCRNGHRYTKGNTRIDGRGVRHCIRCEVARKARRRRAANLPRPGYCKKDLHRITPENDYPWTDRQGRVHHVCATCKREYQRERRATA